ACDGELIGEEPGDKWEHGRYNAPYLRDALLDAGAFAETLETATFWSAIPGLYAAVREALTSTLTEAGTPPLVMCHISHTYENGASLYFTVVSAQGEDAVAHWEPVKRAANDAILAAAPSCPGPPSRPGPPRRRGSPRGPRPPRAGGRRGP
ncbi:FAD-linked oxidase C-terminal domain-containing protein, partial [Streptomyces massasporeus]